MTKKNVQAFLTKISNISFEEKMNVLEDIFFDQEKMMEVFKNSVNEHKLSLPEPIKELKKNESGKVVLSEEVANQIKSEISKSKELVATFETFFDETLVFEKQISENLTFNHEILCAFKDGSISLEKEEAQVLITKIENEITISIENVETVRKYLAALDVLRIGTLDLINKCNNFSSEYDMFQNNR